MIQGDLSVILPEAILSVFAMAALIGAVYTARDRIAPSLTWAAAALMAAMAVWTATGDASPRTAFGGMFIDDGFARFAKVAILLGAAAVLVMSQDHLSRRGALQFEFPLLVTLASVGMMVMVSAGDLIALYMGLELQSLSLYVIASLRR
ncbi:MAG TPA: NADH-quinone oxidoreductase subunit N, partial [Rhizobiales bacterium]|nr:NADH-quinone oxidoreductase subunit N [Hyphomicrobiales bacterium]